MLKFKKIFKSTRVESYAISVCGVNIAQISEIKDSRFSRHCNLQITGPKDCPGKIPQVDHKRCETLEQANQFIEQFFATHKKLVLQAVADFKKDILEKKQQESEKQIQRTALAKDEYDQVQALADAA